MALFILLKGDEEMNPFEGYKLTSPYGWRNHPVYGERRFHTGVDLVKAHQSPIYAFTAGEVLFASEGKTGSGFGGYGNVVAIRDSKGSLHCYCHLDSCLVKVGLKVKRGDAIGRQGNTGVSTGSHLHYEIRRKSSPQFGYENNRENNCYEPTQYLIDFYKSQEVKMSGVFKDIPAKHWAESSVKAVKEAGVMGGYPDGTFKGDQPVTRYELAAALAKLQKLKS